MKMIDTIRRAGRSLRQAKARTLLTSLAIGVGAFTITLSLAAGSGGRQYATNLVRANTDTQELRVMPKMEGERSNRPQEYADGSSVVTGGAGFVYHLLNDRDIASIRSVPGVESVSPVYTLGLKYVTRPGQKRYYASVNTFNANITQQYLAGGGASLADQEILLTDEYRDVLGFKDSSAAIGQTIELVAEQLSSGMQKSFTFKVTGVYKSSQMSFTNGTAMQVSQGAAKGMYDYTNQGTPQAGVYDAASVRIKSRANSESIKSELVSKGYNVIAAQDIMSSLFQFINVLQGILLGFGGLAVLTSIFGIINTQYISVLERTQQIGLMKALGMRRRDVGRLFKLEAAWIGFLGGAIGSVLAVAAGTIANPFISKALALESGMHLLMFEPLAIVAVVGGLMAIAVGAGILPARKAAKLDPIEALRTE